MKNSPLVRLLVFVPVAAVTLWIGNAIVDPAPSSMLTGLIGAGIVYAWSPRRFVLWLIGVSIMASSIGTAEHGVRHGTGNSEPPEEGLVLHLLIDGGQAAGAIVVAMLSSLTIVHLLSRPAAQDS